MYREVERVGIVRLALACARLAANDKDSGDPPTPVAKSATTVGRPAVALPGIEALRMDSANPLPPFFADYLESASLRFFLGKVQLRKELNLMRMIC